MSERKLKPGDLATLRELQKGDVGRWAGELGDALLRFVFQGISPMPGWGQSAHVRYEDGSTISEPWLDRPVQFLGHNGRVEPARLVMDDNKLEPKEAVVTIRVPHPTPPFEGAEMSYFANREEHGDLQDAIVDWIQEGTMRHHLSAYANRNEKGSHKVYRSNYNPLTRTWGEWK